MKNQVALGMMLMLLTLTGCEAIGDIFSAGVYTGLAIVVLVVIIIVWIVARLRK